MKFKLWLENEWQKFQRQKSLPFKDEPFQRYAKSFIGDDAKDFGLDDSQYEPEKMYHVTTNLSAVKADGKLKSRAELKGKGIGLGGGPNNMSPRTVSLTYNYGKALEIYNGLKFVAKIISNQISASAIYDYAMNHHDGYHNDEERLTNADEVLVSHGVSENLILDGDEEGIKKIIDKNIIQPKMKYEFLQELEVAVIKDNPSEDNSEYVQFDPVVGFAAPFESMKSLTPNNIAIIQVVIRKDSQPEHYVQEAEIRVDPKDCAIVRYMQP